MIKSSLLANASQFSNIERFGADVLILKLKFKNIAQGNTITIPLIQDSTLKIDWSDGVPNTSLEHIYDSDKTEAIVLIYSTYTTGNSQYSFYKVTTSSWDLGKLQSVDMWDTTYFINFN